MVIEVISPKFLHHFLEVYLELFSINSSELSESEGPTKESRTETNSSLNWINLLGFSHIITFISGNDNVSVFNDSLEVLIHSLTVNLEFEDTSIDLVDEKNGLDLFSQSLSKHSLSLHTHTFDVIDDDESTISDSEGGSDF